MKKLLFILLITATCYGSGNVEISDEKLKALSPDGTASIDIYRNNTNAYIDWTTGSLFMLGGDISFDDANQFRWDDVNNVLIVTTIDVNTIDANGIDVDGDITDNNLEVN